jgi:hypothetical protein
VPDGAEAIVTKAKDAATTYAWAIKEVTKDNFDPNKIEEVIPKPVMLGAHMADSSGLWRTKEGAESSCALADSVT